MGNTRRIGEVDRLVVHHSASRLTTTFEEIVHWHVDSKPEGNGWIDIGYHHVILYDGSIRAGRPLDARGAHAPPNTGRIGVCLVGDNTLDGEGWTVEQIVKLRQYVAAVRLLFPGITVSGHRDVMSRGYTECPGVNIQEILGG